MARLPGPFWRLVEGGLVDEAEAGRLLALLPPEQYVQTDARGGEAFESTRWPSGRDVRLARLALARLPDPGGHLASVAGEIEVAGGREGLIALQRRMMARMVATAGGDLQMLEMICPGAGADEAPLLSEPPWPEGAAGLAMQLVLVHLGAADGLFAYHVYRGLPGVSSEAAATLLGEALSRGLLTASELVDEAIAIVQADAQSSRTGEGR